MIFFLSCFSPFVYHSEPGSNPVGLWIFAGCQLLFSFERPRETFCFCFSSLLFLDADFYQYSLLIIVQRSSRHVINMRFKQACASYQACASKQRIRFQSIQIQNTQLSVMCVCLLKGVVREGGRATCQKALPCTGLRTRIVVIVVVSEQ